MVCGSTVSSSRISRLELAVAENGFSSSSSSAAFADTGSSLGYRSFGLRFWRMTTKRIIPIERGPTTPPMTPPIKGALDLEEVVAAVSDAEALEAEAVVDCELLTVTADGDGTTLVGLAPIVDSGRAKMQGILKHW